MRSNTVDHNVGKLQQDLYLKLNKFSQKHNILGSASAIPVAAADVGKSDTLKTPLKIIEGVAMTAINLFGAAFRFYNCTVKLAIFDAQSTLVGIVSTPVAVVMVPIKFAYQMFAIARAIRNGASR